MKLTETRLAGAYIIDLELKGDDRGFFAREFCVNELAAYGLKTEMVQCNLSFNHKAGTLRGMHYQAAPDTETKLVRCTQGAIYDVIVDLRPDSPTYGEHVGIELSAKNRRSLYVPEMFAHGYQTLTDNAEVIYKVSAFYAPQSERGLHHGDPALGIQWPLPVSTISPKDAAWSFLRIPVTGAV